VDVYRVNGEPAKALALIDRKLAGRVSTATRQSMLLAKAKILFSQNKFTAARDIFHQLGTMRLVTTPGGATTDEVRYFEALSQSKLGNTAIAQSMWTTLSGDTLSYFGQKAAERLGTSKEMKSTPQACLDNFDPALKSATDRLTAVIRPLRTTEAPAADAVADLMFMRLWDEAFIWFDRARRLDARTAADMAYLAGRYDRAITYADRLPESDMAAWPFVYPAAYRSMICTASQPYGIDPLWLHAVIWQESKYDPNIESAASARGLMQFIPETEQAVGQRLGMQGLTPEQLYDPMTSIRLGAKYWSELMAEFKYPELALAAYNGGPANVRRWRAKLPNADVEFFVSDIGFSETKHYVQAVFAARAAYARNN
jgi:soluble lytic murein transglycosylase